MAHVSLSLNEFLMAYYVPGAGRDTGATMFFLKYYFYELPRVIIGRKDSL